LPIVFDVIGANENGLLSTEDCQLNNAEKRVKLLWILILVKIAIFYAVNFPLCFVIEPFAMDTPLQRTCALPNEKFPSIIS